MPASDLCQHTKEVLTKIGDYSWEEVIDIKLGEIFN